MYLWLPACQGGCVGPDNGFAGLRGRDGPKPHLLPSPATLATTMLTVPQLFSRDLTLVPSKMVWCATVCIYVGHCMPNIGKRVTDIPWINSVPIVCDSVVKPACNVWPGGQSCLAVPYWSLNILWLLRNQKGLHPYFWPIQCLCICFQMWFNTCCWYSVILDFQHSQSIRSPVCIHHCNNLEDLHEAGK